MHMPYVFVAPFFLLFAGFTLYPVLYALVLSVTYWHGVGTPRFIGWGNYTFLLLTDDEFWQSIGNAATLWLLVVPAQTLLAVTGAVVLSAPALRLRWLWRTAFLIPFATQLVAMAQVWKDLFSSADPESGLDGPVNTLLHTLHLPTIGWLTTEEWAKPTLALFLIWKTSGLALVLMMAAVRHIPRELYEAAALDGVGPLTQFRRVTVPLLRRPIAFWVVAATLTIFQMFAEPYVLTGGGPYGATTTPGLFLRAYITNSDLGAGAANSILLIVLVFVLSLLALRLLRPGMDLGASSANALILAAPCRRLLSGSSPVPAPAGLPPARPPRRIIPLPPCLDDRVIRDVAHGLGGSTAEPRPMDRNRTAFYRRGPRGPTFSARWIQEHVHCPRV